MNLVSRLREACRLAGKNTNTELLRTHVEHARCCEWYGPSTEQSNEAHGLCDLPAMAMHPIPAAQAERRPRQPARRQRQRQRELETGNIENPLTAFHAAHMALACTSFDSGDCRSSHSRRDRNLLLVVAAPEDVCREANGAMCRKGRSAILSFDRLSFAR